MGPTVVLRCMHVCGMTNVMLQGFLQNEFNSLLSNDQVLDTM